MNVLFYANYDLSFISSLVYYLISIIIYLINQSKGSLFSNFDKVNIVHTYFIKIINLISYLIRIN